MRKLDLVLSLRPWTSVENLMSQEEVWPHLPGKHLQACKADTTIPIMSPSNHNRGTCHPNRGYTLKFQEITPTVGTSVTGWNVSAYEKSKCISEVQSTAFSGERLDWKGDGGTLLTKAVAQWAYSEGWFGLVDALKKEALLFPARYLWLSLFSSFVWLWGFKDLFWKAHMQDSRRGLCWVLCRHKWKLQLHPQCGDEYIEYNPSKVAVTNRFLSQQYTNNSEQNSNNKQIWYHPCIITLSIYSPIAL